MHKFSESVRFAVMRAFWPGELGSTIAPPAVARAVSDSSWVSSIATNVSATDVGTILAKNYMEVYGKSRTTQKVHKVFALALYATRIAELPGSCDIAESCIAEQISESDVPATWAAFVAAEERAIARIGAAGA